MGLSFSTETKKKFDDLVKHYPAKDAALLPTLYLAQKEFGHVSPEAMDYVAGLLDLSPARVYGVATFYTMYNKQEVGKYLVQVCTNICCALVGADSVYDYLSEKLGISEGETTADKKFTLLKVECLGACGMGPVMQINDTYYEHLTGEKIDSILAELK